MKNNFWKNYLDESKELSNIAKRRFNPDPNRVSKEVSVHLTYFQNNIEIIAQQNTKYKEFFREIGYSKRKASLEDESKVIPFV